MGNNNTLTVVLRIYSLIHLANSGGSILDLLTKLRGYDAWIRCLAHSRCWINDNFSLKKLNMDSREQVVWRHSEQKTLSLEHWRKTLSGKTLLTSIGWRQDWKMLLLFPQGYSEPHKIQSRRPSANPLQELSPHCSWGQEVARGRRGWEEASGTCGASFCRPLWLSLASGFRMWEEGVGITYVGVRTCARAFLGHENTRE